MEEWNKPNGRGDLPLCGDVNVDDKMLRMLRRGNYSKKPK